MKVLLLASAYNGLCQRVDRELLSIGHDVFIELCADQTVIEGTVERIKPDLILCPFLKHRVPESVWRHYPCLIVHPGIEGDRGPSSLDWAISEFRATWGVTLLQADQEMDAGDIWGTQEFPCRTASKGSLYRREVSQSATFLIKQALVDLPREAFQPRPLDYNNPAVLGRERPLMKQPDRAIDWHSDTTATIVQKIHAADGFPGVKDCLNGVDFYLFGVREGKRYPTAEPGQLLGHCEEAVCRATVDGSVWIRQLKPVPAPGETTSKLPAMRALARSALAEQCSQLPAISGEGFSDIQVEREGSVVYVHFDFYNGAMNTEQCRGLLAQLRILRADPSVEVVVLMGGEDFWSNGIHLNCIELADDAAAESWRNINAMDDIVECLLTNTDQMTVAALRCNAGAGGAVLSQACDYVVARSGVVLNTHYKTMGLYGSEYWTYVLPRRVGERFAHQLIEGCEPLLVDEALDWGMVDELLPEDWALYHRELKEYCQSLVSDRQEWQNALEHKRLTRERDEQKCPLANYRREELRRMKATFDDPHSDYHRLRHRFVYKLSCGRTPARLQREPGQSVEAVSA
ncbi:hydrogenase maturation protein [Marinimicrobium locisalis]|uniref:hydrogenase maturation protein n=1 Tax=Marinimicrobium locisalis TaxID=546022 RepID=UPI0032215001